MRSPPRDLRRLSSRDISPRNLGPYRDMSPTRREDVYDRMVARSPPRQSHVSSKNPSSKKSDGKIPSLDGKTSSISDRPGSSRGEKRPTSAESRKKAIALDKKVESRQRKDVNSPERKSASSKGAKSGSKNEASSKPKPSAKDKSNEKSSKREQSTSKPKGQESKDHDGIPRKAVNKAKKDVESSTGKVAQSTKGGHSSKGDSKSEKPAKRSKVIEEPRYVLLLAFFHSYVNRCGSDVDKHSFAFC